MDYSIGHGKTPSEITYSIDIGGRYGKMPSEALVAKFEQTDMGNEEMLYDNHARSVIMSWNTPDAPGLESDEIRKSYSNKGYLNLLHRGGRGEENEPRHPEIFLELTDREPRRTATDPDYRELRKQHEARMRYVRLHADADNSITGGYWDELSVGKAKKLAMSLMKPRFMQFTTSYDGRREGMRRSYEYRQSDVDLAQDQKEFGEIIETGALTPQRHTTILSNTDVRSTRLYQQNTTDHLFQVSMYGEGRRGLLFANNERIRGAGYFETDLGNSDRTKTVKSAGILMGKIVRAKSDVARSGQMNEYNDAVLTQARKSQVLRSDLNAALRDIAQEQIFTQAYGTMPRKTGPGMDRIGETSVATQIDADGAKPAHHYVNAELVYKAVHEEGKNRRKAMDNVITDDSHAPIREDLENLHAKGRRQHRAAKHNTPGDSKFEVDGESITPTTYKRAPGRTNANHRKVQNRDGDLGNSDRTQNRRVNHNTGKITGRGKVRHDIAFLDNTKKERHVAPMGTKYLRREMRTEDTAENRLDNKFSA